MLYFFYGNDIQKGRSAIRGLVKTLLSKKKDAAYTHIDTESFSEDAIIENISNKGLFTERCIVFLDNVLSDKDSLTVLKSHKKDLQSSENIFILLEESPDAKTKKLFRDLSEKSQEFVSKGKIEKKPFNIFSLTDALGKRDKRGLWVKYQEALLGGVTPEEIHGVLFWQLKTLLLVQSGNTKGIKPFVVGKAKSFLNNYKEKDLTTLSRRFVDTYHNARLGNVEFSIGLEKLILEL